MTQLKIVFIFTLLLMGIKTQAKDYLVFNNEVAISGEFKKIKNCQINFKSEFGMLKVPLDSVLYIELDVEEDSSSIIEFQNELTNCQKGRFDANYHGRELGNGVLGFFLGPIGVIGCLLGSANPYKGRDTAVKSKYRDLFNDEEYVKCYRRRQRGRAVTHAAIGWAIIIMISIASNG